MNVADIRNFVMILSLNTKILQKCSGNGLKNEKQGKIVQFIGFLKQNSAGSDIEVITGRDGREQRIEN